MKQLSRRAAREVRGAAADIARSAEAKRVRMHARQAVSSLGKAATAAGALIRTAWRKSGEHARAFGGSREVRALRPRATRAAGSARRKLAP